MKMAEFMMLLMTNTHPGMDVDRQALLDLVDIVTPPTKQANPKNLPLQTLLTACARAGVKVRATGGIVGVGTTVWQVKAPGTPALLARERARHSALHLALGSMGYTLRSFQDASDGKWDWKITPPAAYRVQLDANGFVAGFQNDHATVADNVWIAGHKYHSDAALRRTIKAMFDTGRANIMGATFNMPCNPLAPGEYNSWEKRVWTRGFDDCKAAYADLVGENEKLSRFKHYVHSRLDEAGVTDGPHSKEGCRIGDRLDIVLRNSQIEQRMQLLLARLKANGIEVQYVPGPSLVAIGDWRVGYGKNHGALMARLQELNVSAEWGAGGWKVTLPPAPPVPPLNAELQRQGDKLMARLQAADATQGAIFKALDAAGVLVTGDIDGVEWTVKPPITFDVLDNGIRVNVNRHFTMPPLRPIAVKQGDPGYDLIYRLYSDTLPRPAKA